MNETTPFRRALAVGVSAAALIIAAPALAQTTPPPPASTQGTTVGEIVVTAERRSESLQSTPIAVSAFTAQALKTQRLDGGQNLETSIPNVNYSRSNFGGYNFQIRGVGSKVVGEGGTSGVSFNINELPVAANHFADTDFYDVERVEVLRGPQGTLYGRNATGGAVNVITNKPTDTFSGSITGEYGNYNERKVTGYLNLPLGDMFAVRFAGFGLVRDGFGTNSVTGHKIDGRSLGDGRVTLSFRPNDRFNAYLMYEHYGESDSRNRVGKQLCTTDNGPTSVGGVATSAADRAFLSQGCKAGSLYSSSAYSTVNSNGTLAGVLSNLLGLTSYNDVFAGHAKQDSNLHDIESAIDPRYKANQDLVDLHMAWNVTDDLTLTSITGFNHNTGSSTEDYNRVQATTGFNSSVNTSALLYQELAAHGLGSLYSALYSALFPNGNVSDPQTGTSNKLNSYDYGTTDSQEFTEELRLTSSFKGPLNFSGGLFYSQDKNNQSNYYVESSSLTAFAQMNNALYKYTNGAFSFVKDAQGNYSTINIDSSSTANGSGHNYYDSRNSSVQQSTAAFGEMYWDIRPDLKLTVGLRYTVDQLDDDIYPIELLASGSGFSSMEKESQTWRETTGRVNLDWTPTLSFTNKTLVYLSYSRGYKGGGFNTPCQSGLGSASVGATCGYSLTYQPEFINAYEIGTKNVLLNGTLTLNGDVFYYDYRNYQISQIVAESSVNQNINARIYGAEFEGAYSPIRNLTFNANVGYLHTEITGGSSVDTLNSTAGNSAYTLVKTTGGANCLVDTAGVAALLSSGLGGSLLTQLCSFTTNTSAASSNSVEGKRAANAEANYVNFLTTELGANNLSTASANYLASLLYNYSGGCTIDGCAQSLKGKQLPNSPHWTLSLGAQYVWELEDDWRVTLRGDYYWQDQSYARIYNATNDLLKSWSNVNATLTFAKKDWGFTGQLWVKNAFNSQPITDTYVTDATSGLFTNTFTLDPRTFGVTLTKDF